MLLNKNECIKTKVMRISKQPTIIQIMIHQKSTGESGIFQQFCRMITKDARCTREIKSRVSMTNAAFNKKKIIFTSKLELKISKKLLKGYICSVNFVWC
jgi:hypothetical protein